ncbi:hypothetical protein [Pseudoalteromonas xiamenensis]
MTKKILLAVVCGVVSTVLYLCLMINTVKTEQLKVPQGALFEVHANAKVLYQCANVGKS